jgi:hypothetical protein
MHSALCKKCILFFNLFNLGKRKILQFCLLKFKSNLIIEIFTTLISIGEKTVVFCSTDPPENRRKSADRRTERQKKCRKSADFRKAFFRFLRPFFDFKDSGNFSFWIRRSADFRKKFRNFSVF